MDLKNSMRTKKSIEVPSVPCHRVGLSSIPGTKYGSPALPGASPEHCWVWSQETKERTSIKEEKGPVLQF